MSDEQNDKATKEDCLVENPVYPFEGEQYDRVPRIDAVKLMAEIRGVSVDEMIDAAKDGMVMYPGAQVIRGPEALGLSDVEYFQKLAGVDKAPPSMEEKAIAYYAKLSDEELSDIVKDIEAGVQRGVYMSAFLQELRDRGIFEPEKPVKPHTVLKIGKGDCCDGDMIHFQNGAEVCVVPPQFTEIQELHGSVICIEKAPTDKKLPSKISIMGDGANMTYFARSLMPYWLIDVLMAEAKNDPETIETRKQLWEQMKKAVSKRPRKKKDGSSRSALNELMKKPSAEDERAKRQMKKAIKKSIQNLDVTRGRNRDLLVSEAEQWAAAEEVVQSRK